MKLLSNAVKFNRAGGDVRISGESTVEGSFQITVADTGEGIMPDLMGDLFTPSSRLGAERRGCRRAVTKPVDIGVFLKTIDEMLARG